MPPLTPDTRAHLAGLGAGLPPRAFALFIRVWGQLHGLVVLEAFGHTDFIGPALAEIFDWATRSLPADIESRIPAQ